MYLLRHPSLHPSRQTFRSLPDRPQVQVMRGSPGHVPHRASCQMSIVEAVAVGFEFRTIDGGNENENPNGNCMEHRRSQHQGKKRGQRPTQRTSFASSRVAVDSVIDRRHRETVICI